MPPTPPTTLPKKRARVLPFDHRSDPDANPYEAPRSKGRKLKLRKFPKTNQDWVMFLMGCSMSCWLVLFMWGLQSDFVVDLLVKVFTGGGPPR